MRPSFRSLLLASGMLAGFGATGPALAQDAGDEEIVVTARRTEERLQDVPGAVSAFNAAALERLGATEASGLQGAVPNVNIVQGRGSSNALNVYIRGVGQPDALQTFDPAIGFYVDDVYYSRIRGLQLDLFDVDRIEVLRGPQGTLFGKNTIGGAVRVVTRRPTQDTHAALQVTGGDFGQLEGRYSMSGGLTDELAAGFQVFAAARDGYDGVDGPERHRCARLVLLQTRRGSRPWKRLARSAWIWPRACFRFTAPPHAVRRCCASGCGVLKCSGFSPSWRRAWWRWKRAPARIIGGASSPASAMRLS